MVTWWRWSRYSEQRLAGEVVAGRSSGSSLEMQRRKGALRSVETVVEPSSCIAWVQVPGKPCFQTRTLPYWRRARDGVDAVAVLEAAERQQS